MGQHRRCLILSSRPGILYRICCSIEYRGPNMTTASAVTALRYLEDLWDDSVARTSTGLTCCVTARTCWDRTCASPISAAATPARRLSRTIRWTAKGAVLWVKGSGGDIGSIKRSGFATLYLDKLLALEQLSRRELEDEMVGMYPLCTFGENPVAASIDTRCTAFSLRTRRSFSSGLGHRAGCRRKWPGEDGRVQSRIWRTSWYGCRGSVRVSNWA